MKKTLTAAAMLMAATLTACGGGSSESSAPTDATVADFCKPMVDIASAGAAPTADDLKNFAAALEEVGTPEGITEEQRAGFAVFVNAAKDIEDGATMEDLSSGSLGNVSEEEQANGEAFFTYMSTTCAEELAGSIPTELPTDLPTDLPTE